MQPHGNGMPNLQRARLFCSLLSHLSLSRILFFRASFPACDPGLHVRFSTDASCVPFVYLFITWAETSSVKLKILLRGVEECSRPNRLTSSRWTR
jgi:hypothetical protein